MMMETNAAKLLKSGGGREREVDDVVLPSGRICRRATRGGEERFQPASRAAASARSRAHRTAPAPHRHHATRRPPQQHPVRGQRYERDKSGVSRLLPVRSRARPQLSRAAPFLFFFLSPFTRGNKTKDLRAERASRGFPTERIRISG